MELDGEAARPFGKAIGTDFVVGEGFVAGMQLSALPTVAPQAVMLSY